MKANNFNHRTVDILLKLKIPESEARILIVLNKNMGGLKQKDICIQAYMYQPEASITLKSLRAKEWVTIINRIPTEGKGRPFAIYTLKKPFLSIVEEIEENVTKSYEHTIKDIERLKKIVTPKTAIPKDLYNTKTKKV